MAATGGVVTRVGNKVVHTFTNSGTFTIPVKGKVRVLVVAGGGKGGDSTMAAGGGSAGEAKDVSDLELLPGSYTVTVGDGGVGGINNGRGGDSSFHTVSCEGGKKGGGQHGDSTDGNGINGVLGSGGANARSKGTGTKFSGGNGLDDGFHRTGGGGAGNTEDGSPGTIFEGGIGGQGLTSDITGTSVVYGVGGAGAGQNVGAGGGEARPGGGQGGDSRPATPGEDGKGGGGGGASVGGGDNRGGKGVVIVSYTDGEFDFRGGFIAAFM